MPGRTWDEPANFATVIKMPTPTIIIEGQHTWHQVVFASDCEPCEACGEPVCHVCHEHYADCDCPGPTQDGVIYQFFDSVLYGRFEEEEDG